MKRIVLKISGEAFAGEAGALDIQSAQKVGEMIRQVYERSHEIIIVVGGGNIYRGSKLIAQGLQKTDSHNMSMLATVFNAMTLQNTLSSIHIPSIALDVLHIEFLQNYTAHKAKKYLQDKKVIILTCGTGNPFFSTDTNAVLRALELDCEACIKLTKVDGVYASDPMKDPKAEFLPEVSYNDCIQKELGIFDAAGLALARDNKLPIYVANMNDTQKLLALLAGEKVGTKIS